MTRSEHRMRAAILCASGAVSITMIAASMAMSGCTPAEVTEVQTKGQLFCAVATPAGPIVAGLIEAASPLAGNLAPAVIIATNATSAFVHAACAAAGGVPVSPPPASTTPVPQIAVVPPAATAPDEGHTP